MYSYQPLLPTRLGNGGMHPIGCLGKYIILLYAPASPERDGAVLVTLIDFFLKIWNTITTGGGYSVIKKEFVIKL